MTQPNYRSLWSFDRNNTDLRPARWKAADGEGMKLPHDRETRRGSTGLRGGSVRVIISCHRFATISVGATRLGAVIIRVRGRWCVITQLRSRTPLAARTRCTLHLIAHSMVYVTPDRSQHGVRYTLSLTAWCTLHLIACSMVYITLDRSQQCVRYV